MDVETKEAHQGGDTKRTEDSPQKASVNSETNGSATDSVKHNTRQKKGQTRSRSQTPQKKTEDSKTLHITLKKLDSELNGKEVHEETVKADVKENDNNVENDKIREGKSVKEESSNNAEGEANKDKQSERQKDENMKKEETKKLNNKEKKEEAKKLNNQEKKEEAKKLNNQEKKEEAKKLNNQEKKEETKKLLDQEEKEETPMLNSQEKKEMKKVEASKKGTPKKEKKGKIGKMEAVAQMNEPDTETVEMDPLVISDGPDPELQFDENSDVESGKGSPVIPRCVTRRSQTRNIPTPKTPKSVDQDVDSEKNSATHTPTTDIDNDSLKTDNLNDSCESMDTLNLSTKAEVGSDATRMDYMERHNSNFEESSYISASREKSLSETLRGLSARRSIRPLDDYRRRVLRSNQEKSSLNVGYSSHDSVEHVLTGVKRKSRSITPEERKKFKIDSPDTNSLFSSSFVNIRNKFKSDLPSSTPKLLSYRDVNSRLRYNDDDNFENGDDEKKSWCSIM